jgi:hypothetical protein
MLGIGRMRMLEVSKTDLVAFVSTSLPILSMGLDGLWRVLLAAPKPLGLIGWCLGLIRVLRISDVLLLLQLPLDVIECFLKDLLGCFEGWFLSDGVEGVLLNLYKYLLGLQFYMNMLLPGGLGFRCFLDRKHCQIILVEFVLPV